MSRIDVKRFKHSALLLSVLFVLPLCANAQDDSASVSVVTVSGTTDSEDGSDYYLDANMALTEQRRLILSIGQLYIKSSESDREIQPYTVLLGMESDYEAKIPIGVEVEYWDDNDSVNVKTLRGSLGYQFDAINVAIKPQIREFNFTARVKRESSSEGFSVNVGAELLEKFYLYGEYGKHYYSQILLDYAEILLGFDYVRLKLVNSIGFSDTIYTLGGSVYLSRASLSGYWIQSVSAIDQTRTYSYGGTEDIDLLQDFSLGFSLGAQSTEQDYPDFLFGTLALSYYW
jgi:hypothetical protein